ncbi:unnamed protein product [Tuber melanosporum]|uniref:(Perigord truffle) hypothetical protein n=1 Tax=Tuber melanosporum (strain Mel28) TaxID=656061 RepID=D5GDT1_TUBMM|nr:uncharacterized protein GSTUM_00006259001 [Tuber melanosporum]KAG0132963.1 hypothetical protein HOY82DRAFT_578024 [Tuber indicum]CAZ82674.1 unnamed protein product [Tuber melanosporum]
MSAIYQSSRVVGCRFAFVQRLGPHLFSSFVVEIPLYHFAITFYPVFYPQ